MNRRSVLASAGGLTLAGGGLAYPLVTGNLRVTDVDCVEVHHRRYRMIVAVKNTAMGQRSGTLVAELDFADGGTCTEERSLDFDGSGTAIYTVVFENVVSRCGGGVEVECRARVE